ncbi:MAG: integrase [Acidobacteria bacterium]|nr:MAG: integrase [Acidobacteriota bacterium]
MLEKLYTHSYVVKYIEAPLFPERDRFLAHRAEAGYSHSSLKLAANYQLKVMAYLKLSGERPVTLEEIDEAAQRWASRQPLLHLQLSRYRFTHQATEWLKFLGWLKAPAPTAHPYAQVISQFSQFMRDERGFAPVTIELRRKVVRNFLDHLWNRHIDLRNLSIKHLDQIVVSRFEEKRWSRRTMKANLEVLRAFLAYGEQRGLCPSGLAAQIIAPRIYKGENLPAGPDWETVRRLCASTQTNRPADIRDRAILLLLAVYGLRASEVQRLTLDDIDWEKQRIQVRRSKSPERADVYPLAEDLAEAILRYVRQVRPRTQFREVFIRLSAPLRPFTPHAIGVMVRRRLKPMGVRLKWYGAHSLRHACACRLLAEGLSMKEIGDHLGHRSVFSTAIYAKLDLHALREVANLSLEGLL